MNKLLFSILIFLGLTIYQSIFQPAFAKRIALVIGNNEYANVSKLQKAVNDANALAATLEDLKFKVIQENNADRMTMNRLLGRIAAEIQVGDEVVFYFSGHGVSVDGQNYLLPIDIPQVIPSLEHSLSKEAFSEDEIISLLQKKGARVSVLIIDACRNNPFPKEGTRNVGRSVGLERAGAPKGTFILYSAGLGQEALDRLGDDDKNPNSVFTRKLLPLLRQPGLSISNMAKGLRVEVEDLAVKANPPYQNHRQFPAYYDQLRGRFFFLPGEHNKSGKRKVIDFSADETLWKTIENSTKLSDFKFYLKEHPKGRYSSVAKLKVKKLKETEVAIGIFPDKKPFTRSYNPGDTFKDCDDCPEMVVVPPGTFMMGSPKSEKKHDKNEEPRHNVTIPAKFAVGKFEITRAQFAAFVNETGHNVGNKCRAYQNVELEYRLNGSFENPVFHQEDTHPVVCVNWDDAKAYVKWLNTKIEGSPYKLLSEAEWEYVARAKSTTAYNFGPREKDLCKHGNGADKSSLKLWYWSNKKCKDGYVYTSPVGLFAENNFGVYDMHGNVWEWVEDCWHQNYHGAPKDGTAWTKGGECSKRVLRGGSFSDSPGMVRSAIRDSGDSVSRMISSGFRVSRTLD